MFDTSREGYRYPRAVSRERRFGRDPERMSAIASRPSLFYFRNFHHRFFPKFPDVTARI